MKYDSVYNVTCILLALAVIYLSCRLEEVKKERMDLKSQLITVQASLIEKNNVENGETIAKFSRLETQIVHPKDIVVINRGKMMIVTNFGQIIMPDGRVIQP